MYSNKNDFYKFIDLSLKMLLFKKSFNLKIINFRKNSNFLNFLILCSVKNRSHANFLFFFLIDKFKELGIINLNNSKPTGVNWLIIDFDFLTVHIFVNDYYLTYNLENFWFFGK